MGAAWLATATAPVPENIPRVSRSMAPHSSWRQQRPRQHHSTRVKQPIQQLSNLQSFFVHSSPVVPVQNGDEATCSSSYFSLKDLWSSFDEWSAYGTEIPMRVNVNGVWQDIIQCYVPYLSGLQLFGADHARRIRASSYSSDDEAVSSNSSAACDSSSNSSCTSSGASTASVDSDCEVDSKDSPVSSGARHSKALFASGQGSVLHKQQSLGEPGKPLFEVFESESPYARSPLSDRISELAEEFPALLSMSSKELHPASWFAVAWYPIYRIPALADPTLSRELQASLLTFHSLSVSPTHPIDLHSSLDYQVRPLPPYAPAAAALAWRSETARQQLLATALSALSEESDSQSSQIEVANCSPKAVNVACLRPFAFMPYKVMGQTWVDDYNLRSQHLPMISTAGHWLDRRNVRLPDFDFFSKNFRPLPVSSRR